MLSELMLIRKICGCIKFLDVQWSSQFPFLTCWLNHFSWLRVRRVNVDRSSIGFFCFPLLFSIRKGCRYCLTFRLTLWGCSCSCSNSCRLIRNWNSGNWHFVASNMSNSKAAGYKPLVYALFRTEGPSQFVFIKAWKESLESWFRKAVFILFMDENCRSHTAVLGLSASVN